METENVMLVEEFHVILEIHSWENVMKIQELAQMALVLMLKKLLIQVVQMGNVMETENVILAEESHVILGIQSWENVMKIQELAPMVLVLMLKKLLTQVVQMENVMETENVMLVEEFHVILEIHSWENVMKIQELAQMALVLMLKKLLIQV